MGHGWLEKLIKSKKIIIGRDARIWEILISKTCSATLQGLGIAVIDLGLSSTTPYSELASSLWRMQERRPLFLNGKSIIQSSWNWR